MVSEIAVCVALNIVSLYREPCLEWQKGRAAGLTSAWQQPTVQSLSLTEREPQIVQKSKKCRDDVECDFWVLGALKATGVASFLLLPCLEHSSLLWRRWGAVAYTHTHTLGCIWISSPLNNPAPS